MHVALYSVKSLQSKILPKSLFILLVNLVQLVFNCTVQCINDSKHKQIHEKLPDFPTSYSAKIFYYRVKIEVRLFLNTYKSSPDKLNKNLLNLWNLVLWAESLVYTYMSWLRCLKICQSTGHQLLHIKRVHHLRNETSPLGQHNRVHGGSSSSASCRWIPSTTWSQLLPANWCVANQ